MSPVTTRPTATATRNLRGPILVLAVAALLTAGTVWATPESGEKHGSRYSRESEARSRHSSRSYNDSRRDDRDRGDHRSWDRSERWSHDHGRDSRYDRNRYDHDPRSCDHHHEGYTRYDRYDRYDRYNRYDRYDRHSDYRPRIRHWLVDIPRILVSTQVHLFSDYYWGRVYWADHGHYHTVYRFPIYADDVLVYRPYSYCGESYFATGQFGHSGPVFDLDIHIDF